jgi:hypothetical protein
MMNVEQLTINCDECQTTGGGCLASHERMTVEEILKRLNALRGAVRQRVTIVNPQFDPSIGLLDELMDILQALVEQLIQQEDAKRRRRTGRSHMTIYRAKDQGLDDTVGTYTIVCPTHGPTAYRTAVPKSRLILNPADFCEECIHAEKAQRP